MTVGSLFAGIGGFDLGFTRAGFTVSWQVEIDEWCQGILARHFPNAQRHGDIRGVGAHNLAPVDVICGGFPCQPFSSAGKRGGTEDDRYLWPEMLRVIREVRPTWVVAENVDGLTRGEMVPVFEQVLSDLEGAGYEVQPFVIPACAVDAPHGRERVWVIAYSDSGFVRASGQAGPEGRPANVYLDGISDPGFMGSWWSMESEPCSVVYGLPGVVDMLRPFGNAVVPQIPELIAWMILEVETMRAA